MSESQACERRRAVYEEVREFVCRQHSTTQGATVFARPASAIRWADAAVARVLFTAPDRPFTVARPTPPHHRDGVSTDRRLGRNGTTCATVRALFRQRDTDRTVWQQPP